MFRNLCSKLAVWSVCANRIQHEKRKRAGQEQEAARRNFTTPVVSRVKFTFFRLVSCISFAWFSPVCLEKLALETAACDRECRLGIERVINSLNTSKRTCEDQDVNSLNTSKRTCEGQDVNSLNKSKRTREARPRRQ